MSDSRKAKLALFLAILILPSVLQVGVLISSAAPTNSTTTTATNSTKLKFVNSIYYINEDLEYFFSYLSAVLLVMAIHTNNLELSQLISQCISKEEVYQSRSL